MRPITSALAAVAAVLAVALSAAAQPAATYKTGGEFYVAYRAAFIKAKAIDELLPWMAKARRDQVTKTPADERSMMFDLMKEMDDNENIKVVKETPKGEGAELQVEATSKGSKTKSTAAISLVKEGGAWKLDKESWKGSM